MATLAIGIWTPAAIVLATLSSITLLASYDSPTVGALGTGFVRRVPWTLPLLTSKSGGHAGGHKHHYERSCEKNLSDTSQDSSPPSKVGGDDQSPPC